MDFFSSWKPSNYLVAGLGLKAVNVAAGQPGESREVIKRTKYDITMPIFRAEAHRRKILAMKEECKSNWWGNGFNSMVYDLLFFELEELKIVQDTGHLLNGEYLYVVNKNLVNIEYIKKLHTSGFKNELQCYQLNEKELYNFLVHYKNKAVTNTQIKVSKKNVNNRAKVNHSKVNHAKVNHAKTNKNHRVNKLSKMAIRI